MSMIDSHAHLEMNTFDEDRDAVLERARAAGVEFILSIGNAHPDESSMEMALELCRENDRLATTIGIHPHDAGIAGEKWYQRILRHSLEKKVWAYGEIGLDYHYDFSPRDTQRRAFIDQLIMARELELPVIVHSREAEADTMEILESHWAPPHPGGIMHCFAGGPEMARRCLKLGMHISFAGNITFKKADDLREAAAVVPLDRLLAETDSPYLSPVPFRGKRNEPARVSLVVETLAGLHDVDTAEMARRTAANFKNLFARKWAE